MKSKLSLSLPIVIIWILIERTYSVFSGSVESSVAVGQLLDSKVVYGVSQAIASGAIGTGINIVFIVLLLIVWLKKEKVNAK